MNESLKDYAKENAKKMLDYLIELYEFQENIRITYQIKIKKKGKDK